MIRALAMVLLVLGAACTTSPMGPPPRLITSPATTVLTPEQWRLRARRSGWPAVAVRPLGRWRGRVIPARLFNERVARAVARGRVTRPQLKELWKAAIEQFILDIELETRRVQVDGAKVEAELERMRVQLGFASLEDMAVASGVSLQVLEMRTRRTHRLRKLWRSLATEPSDAAVRQHLRDRAAEYRVRETVHLRHILLRPGDDDAVTKRQAEALSSQARAPGADFAALANQHSQDPSAPRGGDLGVVARGRMLQPIERWAFTAQPGQISDPVRTRAGWHVLKLEARQPGRAPSFELDGAKARERLRAASIARARRAFLDAQMRSRALEEDRTALELVDVP